MQTQSKLRDSQPAPSNLYADWYNLLANYCEKRHPKFPLDDLPAITGLAAFIQQGTKDNYLTGLWYKGILRGLSWRVYSASHGGCIRAKPELPLAEHRLGNAAPFLGIY
jgi:hypothetical protein